MIKIDGSNENIVLKQAIQEALDHALTYGDDRTAFDLSAILQGMSHTDVRLAA